MTQRDSLAEIQDLELGHPFGAGVPAVPGVLQEAGRDGQLLAAVDGLASALSVEPWIVVLAAWACFVRRVTSGSCAPIRVRAGEAQEQVLYLHVPHPGAALREFCTTLSLRAVVGAAMGEPHQEDQSLTAWGFSQFPLREAEGKHELLLYVDGSNLCMSSSAHDGNAIVMALASFREFLAQAIADPDAGTNKLGVVSVAQSEWLSAHSNGQTVAVWGSVLDRVVAQAVRTPQDVAVTAGSAHWTYAELMARTHSFRSAFQRLGVGRSDRIAIILPRGRELLAVLLGTLAAGAVFVPISADQPVAFCDSILRDLEPTLVVCSRDFRHDALHTPVLLVETVNDDAVAVLPQSPEPGELAYIMYTSGSTGTPKGVMVTQEGFSNYVQFAAALYFGEPGGAAMATSIGFDLSITSLFAPLVAGQCVHMFDSERGWLGLLDGEHRFSVIKATPSHIVMAQQAGLFERLCRSASVFVLGGEALSSALVRRMRDAAPSVRIFNEYGPTETVVGSTVHEAGLDDLDDDIDIGLPIPNTECLVLDSMRRPVPPGWVGELHIGGMGVSPGYWRQEALSLERFATLPGKGAMRYYETGDLVRWGSNGRLVYLGRNDSQVKVNGVRVEIASVRATLLAHPGILDAAIVPFAQLSDQKVLHAYVVAMPDARLDSRALLEFMRDRVPSWMVPASMAFIDNLPMTLNGKLDVLALPPPSIEEPVGREASTIGTVRTVWATVLKRDDVGDDVRFFEAGCTSFEVVQIVVGLNSALGLQLKPLDMFHHATIATMAAFIERQCTGTEPELSKSSLSRAELRSRLGQSLRERRKPPQ